MGWWHTTAGGESLQRKPTGLVWGDAAADVIDDAMGAINGIFMGEFNRLPTQAEIIAGLRFSGVLDVEPIANDDLASAWRRGLSAGHWGLAARTCRNGA